MRGWAGLRTNHLLLNATFIVLKWSSRRARFHSLWGLQWRTNLCHLSHQSVEERACCGGSAVPSISFQLPLGEGKGITSCALLVISGQGRNVPNTQFVTIITLQMHRLSSVGHRLNQHCFNLFCDGDLNENLWLSSRFQLEINQSSVLL